MLTFLVFFLNVVFQIIKNKIVNIEKVAKMEFIQKLNKAVVKIYTQGGHADYVTPWTKQSLFNGTGSGFIIDLFGGVIVTNAHVVQSADLLMVRREIDEHKIKAKKLFEFTECDLALIDIDDKDERKLFYKSSFSLSIGEIPVKSSEVFMAGFPFGGHNLSISRGIINRIDTINYSVITRGIAFQIDAPLNPGNSGGPALDKNGKVIGVAVSIISPDKASNIGFIIPTTLLKFFLHRYELGGITGLYDLHISTQKLTNPALKELYKVKDGGVLILDVFPESQFNDEFKPGDILIAIDNKKISNAGNISIGDIFDNKKHNFTETLEYGNLVSLKHPGDKIKISLFRNGREININSKVKLNNYLVPLGTAKKPDYYFIMGLVFVPLTVEYLLQEYEKPPSQYLNYAQVQGKIGEELVFLSNIYANEFTKSYSLRHIILNSVNGVTIRNLQHLKDIVENLISSKTDFVVFEFDKVIYAFKVKDIINYSDKLKEKIIGK